LAVYGPPNSVASPPWLRPAPTTIPLGDNDWTIPHVTPTVAGAPIVPIIPIVPIVPSVPSGSGLFFGDNYQLQPGNSNSNFGVGPNLGCPIPILPLQTSQAVVQSTLSNMKATFRGGTMINVGLNAAWWVISPKWAGMWTAPTPAPTPATTLPQAYDKSLKVVVLMTDGKNQWYDWNQGMPGAPSTSSANGQNDADYTGYGRILEGRSGTTAKNNVDSFLNTKMSSMCTTLKDNNVVIYAIIFGAAPTNATVTLFKNCATAPSYYYYAPNNATLLTVFKKIGQEISSLRLTWPESNS